MKLCSTLSLLAVCLGCNTAPPKAAQLPSTAPTAPSADALPPTSAEQQLPTRAPLASVEKSGSGGAPSFNAAGVAFVEEGADWHCIDKHGRVLATILTFDNGPDYVSEGLIRYKAGSKIGFVDKRCAIRITAEWDFAFPFSNGRAVVCNGCQSQSDGEHSVMVGGKWGSIDPTGKLVVPLK